MSNQTTRRGFLKLLGGVAGALGLGAALPCPTPEPEPTPTPAPLGVSEQGVIITDRAYIGTGMMISGFIGSAEPGDFLYWDKERGQYLKLNG